MIETGPEQMTEKTAQLKTRLEAMTERELLIMADSLGLDLPPDLDRVFIIRELLENSEDDEDQGGALEERPINEGAALPRFYNVTFIEVLPRDPRWAFVFWEIKKQDIERLADLGITSFYLKILECAPAEHSAERAGEGFSEKPRETMCVPVGTEDNSWYLAFPENGASYRVELCAEDLEHPLAVSRPFTLPKCLSAFKDVQ
ncbi:MAG: DUF4912 domain-containing protein [Treponema sp.]|jgi:hypothetical protein|nr:DUF4912 domain-containing protein [Treponema sp.]